MMESLLLRKLSKWFSELSNIMRIKLFENRFKIKYLLNWK